MKAFLVCCALFFTICECFHTFPTIVPFSKLDILRFGFKVTTSSKGVKWPKLDRTKYETFNVHDKNLKYPDYYLRDFHAYDGGNLNWRAAEECMAATDGVMAFHNHNKTGRETNHIIREKFMELTKMSLEIDMRGKLDIVDMACGIGFSTSIISNHFYGNIVGIDMSPYFLNKAIEMFPELSFVHANVESVDIPNNSQDVVFISYLFHELPVTASVNVIREANRILRYGGKLAFLDMDPNIKASSCVKQFIFDNTEPYIEAYKRFYMIKDEILERNGFSKILEVTDIPKTKIVIAKKIKIE